MSSFSLREGDGLVLLTIQTILCVQCVIFIYFCLVVGIIVKKKCLTYELLR